MPLPCRTVVQLRVTSPDGALTPDDGPAARRLSEADPGELARHGPALLADVVDEARAAGATAVELQVTNARDVHAAMAAAHGFALRREVLRLGRDLPLHEPWELD